MSDNQALTDLLARVERAFAALLEDAEPARASASPAAQPAQRADGGEPCTVEDYVATYEFRGDYDYRPTEGEQELLIDALHGWEAARTLSAPKTPRAEVYAAIDGERVYQDALSPERTAGLDHSVGEYVTMLQCYQNDLVTAWTKNAGDQAALDIIRKIAGIAVHCMEQNGVVPRAAQTSEASPSECERPSGERAAALPATDEPPSPPSDLEGLIERLEELGATWSKAGLTGACVDQQHMRSYARDFRQAAFALRSLARQRDDARKLAEQSPSSWLARKNAEAERNALQARVEDLERGLEPFKIEFERSEQHWRPEIDNWPITGAGSITYAHLRQARSLLASRGGGDNSAVAKSKWREAAPSTAPRSSGEGET